MTTPAGAFVARISTDGSELLAIDRDCEYRNSVTAAAAGAGPPVLEYRPQDRLLVIGYLEGRTLGPSDVAAAGNITRIAQACRLLHAGGRFGNDFDMFDIQRRYLSAARSRGFTIPASYDDLTPQFRAAEKALAAGAEGTVPCHNDLLAANFIDDGERIWLIDYELSGNNDACFELGNIAAESHLSADALAGLVTAYYGRPGEAGSPGPGCSAWSACTAGRCGARSSTPRARSTSTSGAGPWNGSRVPPAVSPPPASPPARGRPATMTDLQALSPAQPCRPGPGS